MYKIYYNNKTTTANTNYIELERIDLELVQVSILGILTYMCELSVHKTKDIKEFVHWFTTPHKRYHYNKHCARNNSPQSYLAGVINNFQFGTQYNLSLSQLEIVVDIINTCIDLIEATEYAYDIKLQQNKPFQKLFIVENLFTYTK